LKTIKSCFNYKHDVEFVYGLVRRDETALATLTVFVNANHNNLNAIEESKMSDERNHLIYKIKSPSSKVYIGQTVNLKQRLNNHKNKRSSCIAISNAIQKYGWDNMTVEVLHENLTLDEANELEEFEIVNNNSLIPNGYNMLTGGANSLHTEVTKNKISIANKGKKRSEEHCKRMSEINTGKKIPPEIIAKIVATNTGKKRTQEFKDAMSKLHTGRIIKPESIAKAKETSIKNGGYTPTQDTIDKFKTSYFKVNFIKEYELYKSKIDTLDNNISFSARKFADWLGVNSKTVLKKIADGLFDGLQTARDNHNRKFYNFTKPIIVNYYESMHTKLFGDKNV
jgi:group I intron endonuclease